jgi:hypothetical protein
MIPKALEIANGRVRTKAAVVMVRTFSFVLVIASFSQRASAQISVVGNTVEEHSAQPGEIYHGTVLVRNLTTTAQPVRIYQTDYMFFADGTSRFDAPGSVPRSNAQWITPSTGSVILPPSGEATVAYTVRVPPGDTLRGTYWSAIMFEGSVNVPTQSLARQLGVGSILRYAVQIATNLNEHGVARAIFEKQRLETSSSDSTQALAVDLRNAGERGYRPLVWIELYDSGGSLRARVQQQRGLLYPGTSLKARFDLGKLPTGTYKAVVFADIHEDAVTAAQYTLRF